MSVNKLEYAEPVATERAQATRRLASEIAKALEKVYIEENWNPVIDHGDFKHLHVTLSDLDLEKPGFMVRPQSLATVTAWLNETKPWDYAGYGNGRQDWYEEQAAWRDAISLSRNLFRYVSGKPRSDNSRDDSVGKSIMTLFTPWGSCRRYEYSHTEGRMWTDVEAILEPNDTSLPHITAILSQDYELEDDRLTAMELHALAFYTDRRINDNYLEKNEYIPVTLISFGGCYGRVINGYFDGPGLWVHLKMSKVMSFEEKGDLKKDDWKRLIGWLLATPLRSAGSNYEKPVIPTDSQDNISESSEEAPTHYGDDISEESSE